MLLKSLIVAATLLLSGCVNIRDNEPKFELISRDDRGGQRFYVKVINRGARPICIADHSWPNANGNLPTNENAYIEVNGTKYRMNDLNDEVYSYHSINAGEFLDGYILYSNFNIPSYLFDRFKILNFEPAVFVC